MIASLTAALIETWEPGSTAPPHRRLGRLLQAAYGPEAVPDETLGARSRRLLRLHRELVGGAIEGFVTCDRCTARSEFAIPVEAIMEAPLPAPQAKVRVRAQGRTFRFRLPWMSDIEAASGLGGPDAVRQAILERCALGSEPPPAAVADQVGARFEALDPAANIVLNIVCSTCSAPIAASVDIATFVARDLDRIAEGLLRDIHAIATAYGWSEAEIVALPPRRRRRYVAMIAHAAQAKPRLAWSRS